MAVSAHHPDGGVSGACLRGGMGSRIVASASDELRGRAEAGGAAAAPHAPKPRTTTIARKILLMPGNRWAHGMCDSPTMPRIGSAPGPSGRPTRHRAFRYEVGEKGCPP